MALLSPRGSLGFRVGILGGCGVPDATCGNIQPTDILSCTEEVSEIEIHTWVAHTATQAQKATLAHLQDGR